MSRPIDIRQFTGLIFVAGQPTADGLRMHLVHLIKQYKYNKIKLFNKFDTNFQSYFTLQFDYTSLATTIKQTNIIYS